MTDYSDSLTETANGAAETASRARSKIEPKLKAVSGAAHEAYDSLRDVAVEAMDETRTRVKGLATQAADRLQNRYGDLEAWVQLKPAQALGVAAGIGVVLGLLLRGRSTKTVHLRDPH
jgi:ElaB/YqjD/DUF883 family membrane-anchored ribosome-binding protein